jgi:recombination protein RecT
VKHLARPRRLKRLGSSLGHDAIEHGRRHRNAHGCVRDARQPRDLTVDEIQEGDEVARLKTGEVSREVMSVAEIEKVRARPRAKDAGPWVTDYSEMCRKTVARRHSKVLPMSTDLDDLIRRDDELYDFEAAKEDARGGDRPRSLAGRLDASATPPTAAAEQGAPAHDPETGEIEEGGGDPADADDETAEAGVAAGPAQDAGAADPVPREPAPASDLLGDNPLQAAYERGRKSVDDGMSDRATPPEFRASDRQAEMDEYKRGRADRKAELAETGRG